MIQFDIMDLPWCRLSQKLSINSQKVGDESVQKLLKNCYFIFKVTEKLLNSKKLPNSCYFFFYLIALEVGFMEVFTRRISLDFSFSSYFSFFESSEIGLQPFSFLNRINRAFICVFFSAGI